MEEKKTSNFCLTNAILDITSQSYTDPDFISTVFGNEESDSNMLNQFICGFCWDHVKQAYEVDNPVPKISEISRVKVEDYTVIYVRFAEEFVTTVNDTAFFIFALKDNFIRFFVFSVDTPTTFSLTEMRLSDKELQARTICRNETMETLNQHLQTALKVEE